MVALSPDEVELVEGYRRLVAREEVPGVGRFQEIRLWWNGTRVMMTTELRK